jgi:hypothetical protein
VADFIAGLDLGCTSDYSALALVRREPAIDTLGQPVKDHRGDNLYDFNCVNIERYALGTSYPVIVSAVAEVMGRRELRAAGNTDVVLAVDATGAGRPVVDMFLAAPMPCEVVPVTITGGLAEPRRDCWSAMGGPTAWWTPKVHLVSAVQAALQGGRLKVAPRLRYAELLKKELFAFNAKVTAAGNDTFEAREGVHDDLVLAVVLAVWLGSQSPPPDYSLGELTGIPIPRRRLPGRPGGSPDEDWHRRAAEAEETRQRLEERQEAAASTPAAAGKWPEPRWRRPEPQEEEDDGEDFGPRRRRIRNFYGRGR